MSGIIVLNQVSFSYGENLALRSLSYEVHQGEIFALLGPNGAGKTTAVRLMNGLLHPKSGYISVLNCNPDKDGEKVRMHTGVLTETPALYERLTAMQNLQFFATLAGMPENRIRH